MIVEMTQLGPSSSAKLLRGVRQQKIKKFISGDLYEMVNANDYRSK